MIKKLPYNCFLLTDTFVTRVCGVGDSELDAIMETCGMKPHVVDGERFWNPFAATSAATYLRSQGSMIAARYIQMLKLTGGSHKLLKIIAK